MCLTLLITNRKDPDTVTNRPRKTPDGPAKIVGGEPADTIRAAIRSLERVSARDDFDVSDLTFMYRCDAPNSALQAAVTRLRQRGFTWEDIGRATGMARSSAYQRWK